MSNDFRYPRWLRKQERAKAKALEELYPDLTPDDILKMLVRCSTLADDTATLEEFECDVENLIEVVALGLRVVVIDPEFD